MARGTSDALAGVRVIDFSSMLAGPYAAMLLASMGADVVKVEPVAGDPARRFFGPPFVAGDSTYFQAVNLDKRSIAIDLGSEEGSAAARRMIAGCDVVIVNLREASLERLGLTEEAVRAARADVVYCAVHGFGRTGPLSAHPGMDLVFQGLSGHMSLTGSPDGEPVRAAAQMVDVATGAFGAAAVAGALAHRARTGEGRRVDVNLLDVGFALQNTVYGYFLATGTDPERIGSGSYVSVTNCFPTADSHVNVTIPHDGHWKRLCVAIGREDLLEDPRYASNDQRVLARVELETQLRATFATRTTAEWLERLEPEGVPCGPVLTYSEAVAHPQTRENEVVLELDHPGGETVRAIAPPLRMPPEVGEHRCPPPLSHHAEQLLAELGYSEDERSRLFDDGVVARPAAGSADA